MKKLILLFSVFSLTNIYAQSSTYWQQKADYKMQVSMDVNTYQYTGKQQLVYTNNSNDTLRKVYYHLYNNAFQPGSEMDMRIQNIKDPDGRMVTKTKIDDKEVKISRISKLSPSEIGYLHISNFKQDGVSAVAKEVETILEVTLAKPLFPKKSTSFTLDFNGQVPIQIRRSGRNNKEGVALSMSQWYPKLAEYDFEGWHANPYIAREFHGVWGNFDVKITIDSNYILGGTGYLQNPNAIGYGYQDKAPKIKTGTQKKEQQTLTWHFIAPNVHDFTWAADKDYLHDVVQVPDGPTLHFLYKNNPKIIENWKNVQPKTVKLMQFFNKTIGKYPYKQYSIIQGGDGGMEYAMCTLILGEGNMEGLTGVIAHEMAHSWFQHVLATNESKHGWMDEGFASFLETLGLEEIADKKSENPFANDYNAYINMANSGKEQPQGTHADRFDENRVYSITSYVKGCLFAKQLDYLLGNDKMMTIMKRYYAEWKMKHPTPNDFKRVAEKVSGAELDWYLTDWTKTTNTIDYSIKSVSENGDETKISLERIGRMPMPIELNVEYINGSKENFYIPLRMMSFIKENQTPEVKRTVLKDWTWGNPYYEFTIPFYKGNIKKITIDPLNLMADVKKDNNIFENK